MQRRKQGYRSIDEYIRLFSGHIQKKLQEMREVIKEQAPQAQEEISYQMSAFFSERQSCIFCGAFKAYRFLPDFKRHYRF
jgi:uncharacterized protein YdhG (YjbR/CyaY superfamily)